MKVCSKCKTPKGDVDFRPEPRNLDGLRSCCRACDNLQWAAYRSRPENKPKIQAYRLNWEANNKERRQFLNRRDKLQRFYGLTIEQFEEMKDAQNSACAICKDKKKLVVDHDHNTGIVRGLLCAPCNAALGGFKDSVLIMEKAIDYIKKNNE